MARVLIVSHDPVEVSSIKAMLERMGYDSEVAADGFEAVALLGQMLRFDAVVLACETWLTIGYRVDSALRSAERGTRRIPVIAVSPSGTLNESTHRLGVKVDDFLARPVDAQSLAATLERCVDHDGSEAARRGRRASGEVLDHARLESLHGLADGRGSLRDRIIDAFLTTTPGELARVRAAVAARSDRELLRAAHWIKGSAFTVGAPRVAAACAGVESGGQPRNWEVAATEVEALAREVESAMTALRGLKFGAAG